MLTVERISDREGFCGLEAVWNPLLKQSASDTIALTHEWLLTWWDVFGPGRELMILVVRDDSTIIGIAPLLRRRVSNLGLPYRRIEFLASGEDESEEICSDYLDFIMKDKREGEVLQTLFSYLQRDDDWDEMLLSDLLSSSPTVPLLQEFGETTHLKCDISPTGEAVFLPLPDDWETLLNSFDRRLRSKTRRDMQLARNLGCDLQILDVQDDFDEGFDALVQLHQQLWISRGEPGAFASERFCRFHRELTAKLRLRKLVRIFLLRCEGNPVAGLYAFIYHGKVYYYQSGFALSSNFNSPGSLIRNLAIEHCISEGIEEWDFLKSEPGSYKYRWSKHTRSIVQVRLAKTHLKETVFTSSHRVVDGLRHIKRSLKR